MTPDKTMALALQCERFLGRDPRSDYPRKILTELLEEMPEDAPGDTYGSGALIEDFEHEVAGLLGKEAAVFMPSGTMAQQIAVRIWSERRGTKNVAFHPTCHLEIHEQKGYQMLHGLLGVIVGNPHRIIELDDLQRIAEPLAALLLELPQREIGGVLPGWDDLVAQTGWAREKGIAVHMDGARLWECGPFYNRPYAEIAGLFDTVYVSFYKGLRGITGAVLTGPGDFIKEARVWQRRYGGNLKSMWPYVLSARAGLRRHLPRMPLYAAKACEVAEALSSIPGVQVTPNPPHTNMMHVFLPGDRDRLIEARDQIANKHRAWLFWDLAPCQLPSYRMFELTIQEDGLKFEKEEVREIFGELMEMSKG